MDSDTSFHDCDPEEDYENDLLVASRNGETSQVEELMEKRISEDIDLDINCKGKSRSTRGWTPLHLASYFGHSAVVEVLINNGADVNVINDVGDTPLHRAAYTGRLDVVQLLLTNDADISMINSEGQSASMVAKTPEIKDMIKAAEDFEIKRREADFLSAAREGKHEIMENMLRSSKPPNINCVDKFGNTALHLAAYRQKPAVAVLLLQNGIDTTLKNSREQVALDMATDAQMKQIIDVKPIKELTKTVERFEGPLLKKSRFMGWKPMWTVLERGVISIFRSRADATTGARRKGFHYLHDATIETRDSNVIVVTFADASTWTFAVDLNLTANLTRQKWENSLKEHIGYSNHFLQHGGHYSDEDNDEEMMPLGSMQDMLQTASAHQQLLEKQVQDVTSAITILSEERNNTNKTVALVNVKQQLNHIIDSSREMCSSLSHCLNVFNQQEEVRKLQLQQESEKCRVLQDALHVLAKEQYHLERTISSGGQTSPDNMFEVSDDEEFYDCTDESVEGKYTPYSKGGKMSQSSSKGSIPSLNGDQRSKWGGRTNLPVPMFSRNDFSVWSILKQCIGKELSKITMPVIFNEPLSFLQRIVEYTEYATLLRKANECDDPVERLEYVTAFAVSATASNWERIGKPFNPLLGETYEMEREDLGFRIVCEQVSHHPPVSAFHTEADFYTLHGAIHPKLKFWGKSVEVTPKGTLTLHLKKHDEVYTWQNVNCCVHNIIVGKLWIEHYGAMEVVNVKHKLKSVLNFKSSGWLGKDLHKVEGYLYDRNKRKLRAFYGKWVEAFYSYDIQVWEQFHKSSGKKLESPAHAVLQPNPRANGTTEAPRSAEQSESGDGQASSKSDNLQVPDEVPVKGSTCNLNLPGQVLLWQATPKPKSAPKYYQFTHFAMMLNEWDPEIASKLPPTDSRRRPDMRQMEEGNIDGAAEEKNRLEEKQRAARKERKKKKDEWIPLHFVQGNNPHTGKEDWLFTGNYWNRQWANSPDIF